MAALVTTSIALGACGGESPPPAAPPPPAPPPAASSASEAAPPAPVTPPPPPKPALSELIPQTLKGVTDAFNAHDAKKLASLYTEDAVVIDYGAGSPSKGRGDMTQMVQSLFDSTADAKAATTREWIKGNVAVTEIAWSGTAGKKPVGQLRVHVAWFNDDGSIKEEHQYSDGAGFAAQLAGKKTAPAVPTLPTGAPEVHVAKGTPDEDKLADWAKTIDDTWSKDDAKAATALFADDGDFWTNMGGPVVKGKKDLAKGFTGWFKTFPDQKWTVSNAWGIDGFAIVEDSLSGTQKGALGPLPASGKPVTNWHFVEISQPTADGKVSHQWTYGNTLEATSQIAPPKSPPAEKPVAKAGGTKADATTKKNKQ